MREKEDNLQRNTRKDSQKAWRSTAQDHFKRLQKGLAAWKQNM